MDKKTAVVLFNLGGPSSEKEIFPFLFSLFYDRAILNLPTPLRYLLAKYIAFRRLKKAKAIYGELGGKSPLLPNTKNQAKALQKELGVDYRVFVAMRHAPPFILDVFREVMSWNPQKTILLPLTPHYSLTTTGSFLREWEKAKGTTPLKTRTIGAYPTLSGFIEAISEQTRPLYEKALAFGTPSVLLVAHGLPQKIINQGDPYQVQIEETAHLLRQKLSLPKAILCYQSRVGRLPWIGPFLEDEVRRASLKRRPLVVVPISFVSEHSETLVELDLDIKTQALKEGCPFYGRVPTVQTHPLFIRGLASLIKG